MIIQGDALEQLKILKAESVDCCITSPPYWALRDYGVDDQLGLEPIFTEYINKLCNVFDEVKRALKKSGSCWVNLADTYSSGNQDYIGAKTKSLCQIPARFSIEMSNRGWILRNTIIWHKPNCMPESVKDRFTNDFEYLFFFVKNKKYYFKQQFEPLKKVTIERYARGVSGKHKYKEGASGQTKQGIFRERRHTEYDERGANKRSVWRIPTKSFSGAHFAVYPEELLETPIKATLPPSGVLLDPFFGSGTTAAAQKRWQPSAKTIGIELSSEYIKIAKKRNAQEVLAL